MSRISEQQAFPEHLREQAESALARNHILPGLAPPSAPEALLHELQVHHIELLMQNDELRRREAELRTSREAYRSLYEGAPTGYLTLDSEGRCLEANQRAATLLGVSLAQLLDHHLASVLADAPADKLHIRLRQLFDHDDERSWELEPGTAGAAAVLQVDTSRFEVPGRQPTCRMAMTDVSERRKLLDELKALKQGLEASIDERTQALNLANQRLTLELAERQRLEEQMVEARKLEAIARLAGGVAHEFNNQLTVISLELDALAGSTRDQDDARLLAVRNAIAHSALLTTKLLAFAQRGHPHGASMDLAFTLEQMQAALRRVLPERIALELRVQAPAAWIRFDEMELEQVVMNLISNARDSIEAEGRIDIVLDRVVLDTADAELLPRARAGRFARMSISDTGRGIAADQLRHIFEPFYTTKGRDGGRGLGLSSVYGLVEGSSGFVDVTSVLGAGTRFSVYLPEVASPVRTPRPSMVLPPPPEMPAARPPCVLVVDDHPTLRQAMCQVISGSGYDVVAAASAADGLEALARRSGAIDLVISDVIMPGMQGVEFFHSIRTLWPRLPVILISGYTAEAAIPAGAHFLPKPFAPDELLSAIRETLDDRARVIT